MDWLYGRQVVRLACAGGAKRRPRRLAATHEGRAWLAAHGVEPAATSVDRRPEKRASGVTTGRIEVETLEPRELQRLTGSHEHQGVACLVGDYPYAAPDDLLAHGLLVVLDEVTDPRNVGAVARSALAAGAGGLALPRHRAAAITPAAVKASAGATEHLDIAHVTNVASFLARCKGAGFWVYGAAGDAGRSYDALDLGGPVVLVFGAEGRGLRPLVRRACDELAAIPMEGPVDSLNVSVAAALFLFEARRRRVASDSDRAPHADRAPAAGREPKRGGGA